MQARILTRTLLVSAAFAMASSAMAQASDKDRSAPASKPITTKSQAAKAAATKRLDFSPSSNVKETSTRPSPAGANTQMPAREGSHCDHSGASDA